MKKVKIRRTMVPVLVVSILGGGGKATAAELWSTELWSEPTVTEQWSEPAVTEQWSEPTVTEQWAEPVKTEVWSEPLHIQLQIDSPIVLIRGEERRVNVAPTMMNGRTMVPFRFLGEAIDASVDWDGTEQKITLVSGSKTIILKVGETTALVNGNNISLDAPPQLVNGSTLVPLRFVTENMDMLVDYTASTKTIDIRSKESLQAPAPTEPPSSSATAAVGTETLPDWALDYERLYGTWNIWTQGSATNLYYVDTGNYATHEYDAGAAQGTLTINEDNTYKMNHSVYGKAEGTWRLSYPREINGEVIQAIVLLDGPGGSDWAVAPSANGTIRLLYDSGIPETWIISDVLSK